jgi:hypothetical protein
MQPVASNDLKVGTTYIVRATIYNDATVDAVDTDVTFQWAFWGSGQKNWILIGKDTITVPDAGHEGAEVEWTPSITGHTCITVEVYHPWDENIENNKGQENTDVKPVSSPGVITFTVGNPTLTSALVYLQARQVGNEELWYAQVNRDYPQVQRSGENKTATLKVEPPLDTRVGERRVFTVSGYINGELIGGVEVAVVVKSPSAISCSVSPLETTLGSTITVSGSIDPAVTDKPVILTYVKPDGSVITRTATTSAEGSYSDSYAPDSVGAWNVTSSWLGDATHDESISLTQSFTITSAPPIPCEYLLVLIIAAVLVTIIIARRYGQKALIIGLILIVITLVLYYWFCMT